MTELNIFVRILLTIYCLIPLFIVIPLLFYLWSMIVDDIKEYIEHARDKKIVINNQKRFQKKIKKLLKKLDKMSSDEICDICMRILPHIEKLLIRRKINER